MEITTLGAHKGNTWKIAFDDEETLYFLHVSVVHRFGLERGMTLSESDWETVQNAELSRKAYQHACYLLDHRGYSFQEMYHKLEPKYPSEVCLSTVNRLAKYGLINDRAYAEQMAHHYVEIKRFGLRRAYQEMRRRGLLAEQISEALEPYEARTAELLAELIRRKYRRYFLDAEDRKTIEKGKAALVRQGYDFSLIREAVNAFLEETAEES